MKKKTNKKSTFKLYAGWQTLLEFIAVSCVGLFVMSVDSEWTVQYFQFVGVLVVLGTVSGTILHKYGKY